MDFSRDFHAVIMKDTFPKAWAPTWWIHELWGHFFKSQPVWAVEAFQPFCRPFLSFLIMNKTGLITFSNTLRKRVVQSSSFQAVDTEIQFNQHWEPCLQMPSVLWDQPGLPYQPQQDHILTGFHQFDSGVFFFFFFTFSASCKSIWLWGRKRIF